MSYVFYSVSVSWLDSFGTAVSLIREKDSMSIPGQITKTRNLDISDFDKTWWNGSPQEVIQMCKIFLVCDH